MTTLSAEAARRSAAAQLRTATSSVIQSVAGVDPGSRPSLAVLPTYIRREGYRHLCLFVFPLSMVDLVNVVTVGLGSPQIGAASP